MRYSECFIHSNLFHPHTNPQYQQLPSTKDHAENLNVENRVGYGMRFIGSQSARLNRTMSQ